MSTGIKISIFVFSCLYMIQTRIQAQVNYTINYKNKKQIIHDFGASGCWNSENIGKYWPESKRTRMAELLFSQDFDSSGNPKGIALSSYRFNIGAGSAEQGESSNIYEPSRRVECFLDTNGNYDFSKQSGYQWFVRKAKEYGVPTLIAFVNSPPVFMNYNGLAFKSNKDGHTNLKKEKYTAFADFLANTLLHFEKEGIHFDYISPINEPQWEWAANDQGKSSQEGSPYTNSETAAVIRKIDSVFTVKKVKSSIFIIEAGQIDRLYQGKLWADNQIDHFWNPANPNYLGNLKNFEKNVVSGHSYWTESSTDRMIQTRQQLYEKLKATNKGLQFWQTEYSFLGDGFRDGNKGRRSQIDCALFLAKIIHHDLTLLNSPVWQFWTAIDPTPPDREIRYNLISAIPNSDGNDGEFYDTKSLWALGNYSRFVRPGMTRIETERNDRLSLIEAANNVMLSAYYDDQNNKIVIVIINYTSKEQEIELNLKNFPIKIKGWKPYITSESDNLKPYPAIRALEKIRLQSRSVTTLISTANSITD